MAHVWIFAIGDGCTAHETSGEPPASRQQTTPTRSGGWSPDPPGVDALFADDPDPVRVKGLHPDLVLHRKRGRVIERLAADAAARAGDVVQISYIAGERRHGVIVSLDSRGAVTLHHPTDVTAPTEIVRRGETPLAEAYQLDDAAFERFILVTAMSEPVDVARVLRAAEHLASSNEAKSGALKLPARWSQTSLILPKVP